MNMERLAIMIASDQFPHGSTDDHDAVVASGERPARQRDGSDTVASPVISLRYPVRAYRIPAQPSPLIGRDDLVAKLSRLLDSPDVRLLSLVGPGGVGKTRLACELAIHREQVYDSVFFIDLGQLNSCASVEPIIRDAITPRWVGLQTSQSKRGDKLVVLDNFEHVIDAAPVIANLLTELPWLQIIATSRIPLRIRWEHSFAVPPLRTPPDDEPIDVSDLAAVPAVALFTSFIRLHHPGFEVGPENAEVIAALCRRMDGLPLALELAAADLRSMPLERLLERLDHPLDTLVHGPRDLPKRQQTMRSTIGWSFALLPPREQRVASQLAVFASGASLDAVATVLDLSAEATDEVLTAIADHNLIEVVDEPAGTRFQMWHVVREYLLERLATDAQRDLLIERFLDYYRTLVRAAGVSSTGVLNDGSFQTLINDVDNIKEALHLAREPRHRATVIDFTLELVPFWGCQHQLTDGRRRIERLIELLDDDAPEVQAKARIAAARLALLAGDARSALEYLSQAQSACADEAVEQRRSIAGWLCYAQILRGDLASATSTLDALEAQSTSEELSGDTVDTQHLRVMIAIEQNDPLTRQMLADALQEAELSKDHARACELLCMQADLIEASGDLRRATRLFAEALVRAQVSQSMRTRIPALIGLGDVANDSLTNEEALHHYREALDIANAYGDNRSIARILERIAVLGPTSRATPEWLAMLGQAEAMRRRLDLGRSRLDELRLRPRVQHLRELLGHDEFDRIIVDGEARTLEATLAVLEPAPGRRQPNAPPAVRQRRPTSAVDMLTPREREVVQQISQGHTNRQIAAILGMSERTVDTHVSNIRQKLQLPSRARIAVWAVAQGLSSLD